MLYSLVILIITCLLMWSVYLYKRFESKKEGRELELYWYVLALMSLLMTLITLIRVLIILIQKVVEIMPIASEKRELVSPLIFIVLILIAIVILSINVAKEYKTRNNIEIVKLIVIAFLAYCDFKVITLFIAEIINK